MSALKAWGIYKGGIYKGGAYKDGAYKDGAVQGMLILFGNLVLGLAG